MTKLTANPKAALFLGVLGAAFSSFFVRWSQAPSLFTATCRLGWTVVLLLGHSLDRDRLWERAGARRRASLHQSRIKRQRTAFPPGRKRRSLHMSSLISFPLKSNKKY